MLSWEGKCFINNLEDVLFVILKCYLLIVEYYFVGLERRFLNGIVVILKIEENFNILFELFDL